MQRGGAFWRRPRSSVVVVNDQDAAHRITQAARHANPTLQLITRTRFLADRDRLRAAGADVVVPEEIEASVQIFAHVLRAHHVPPDEVQAQVGAIRAHDYALLRGGGPSASLLQLDGLSETGVHSRTVELRQGCPIVGQSLDTLQLDETHSLRVRALYRGDRELSGDEAAPTLQVGDRLVMEGTAAAFVECADLFRGGEVPVEEE